MKLRLIIIAPEHWKGTVVPVGCTPYLIGRDGSCQLRFKSSTIAMHHCAVLVRDHRVFIRTLAEPSSTLVNNEPVQGELEVEQGDRVQLGHLTFAIRIEQTVKAPTGDEPSLAREEVDETAAELLLAMDQEETSQPAPEQYVLHAEPDPEHRRRSQEAGEPMTAKAHPDHVEAPDTGAAAGDLLRRMRKSDASGGLAARRR
jgi:pSer/pThr/pTyr-binding forkhead associated (FHA) protein